ncbi:MAG: (2Fe-2S)-binding protein [Pseudomonadales bacterium]|nr:(2Fe-2S)-binding protein [Pseudomonadales bacterium]
MISFYLNGVQQSLEIDADTPLLWAIRDHLKLTGTKYGCGIGSCGACTVHLDGLAIRSCTFPVSALKPNHQITTIEGLSEHGDHPVQQAWISNNVPQCGYCQPGQIMSASALLAKNPQPNDEDINNAMSGNICRCGTYPRIRKAIHDAATILKS